MAPTHFLCLPLITPTSHPQLEKSLQHLRSQTQSKTADRNEESSTRIPESAYRPLGVLHLTLGVMNLLGTDGSRDRLDAALRFLQSTDLRALLQWAGNRPRPSLPSQRETSGPASSFIDSATSTPPPPTDPSPSTTLPLEISLTGLTAFPTPSKATVLSAEPTDPTSRLYYFAHALRQNFVDAGFLEPEDRPLVLHATLINTVYSKSGRERSKEKGRGQGRIALDVRELVRRFNEEGGVDGRAEGRRGKGRFVWAEGIVVGGVRMCKMGAKRVEGRLGMEYEVVGEKSILGRGEEEGT